MPAWAWVLLAAWLIAIVLLTLGLCRVAADADDTLGCRDD